MTDEQKIAISEGKDFINDIEASMIRTRNASWQLLLFIIAIDVYLIKFFIEENQTFSVVMISFFCIPLSGLIYTFLFKNLFPSERSMNGIEPQNFETILGDNSDVFGSVMRTYQSIINDNSKTLDDMTKAYRNAVYGLISMVALSVLLLGLRMFCKCCPF